ncbi:MAG: carbohydrate-binding domain-containing protein, partial [Oscillospiraceae bacterium]|nr:carbohydrate-binding domain-containing protein [Oscillospiraceae bacterium]
DNGQSGNGNSSEENNTEKPADPEPEPEPEPESGDATIELKGDSAECSSSNVSINVSEVTIKAEGKYRLTGSLNGTVIVAAPKDAKVDIELAGVNISCSNGSAIRVDTADKVKIISAGGTENTLSDGGSSEACIFSKEDITLKGDGVIKIYGNVKNAVQSKNTLKITGGTFEVSSPNNGLVGKDKVAIEAGQITINSSRDAIKATNETEAGKGVVYVTGGNINITAGDDAIQAISEVTVNNCSITARIEGKKVNCTGAVNVDEGCITKIK